MTRDLDLCAEKVANSDPDRFLAAMAAPVALRPALLPLYAANLEIARAAWVTEEPMIAEMRLQWWRDAVEDAARGEVRAHEVVTPLAGLIRDRALPVALFEEIAEARRWDIYREPHADAAALISYLDATSDTLMALSMRAIGVEGADAGARALGRAQALAAYLRAVPELESRGRVPLVDGRGPAVAALARQGLDWLDDAKAAGLPRAAAPALRAAWQAGPILRMAARDPALVGQGALTRSEAARRAAIMWRAFLGTW